MRIAFPFALMAAFMLAADCIAAPAAPVGSAAWVIQTVATLQHGSATEQQDARQQLMRAGEMKSMPVTYPASLAAALLPVLRGNDSRAKLNAAVAIERVAAKTASPSLLPAVDALLDDRCDAVALWGIKSARPLIAAGGATTSTLAGQVASTVKAHPNSGPVAEEAYAALLPETMQPSIVDALLATLSTRIAAYATGAAPPSPLAEQSVPAYLAATCWPQATPAGRDRILTELGRLTCVTAGAIADGSTNRNVLAMTHLSAGAVEAIANQMGNTALITAAQSLKTIQSRDAANIPAACKAFASALRALGIVLQSPPATGVAPAQ